jgi:DNA-binding NarL/FixJ family response regulator
MAREDLGETTIDVLERLARGLRTSAIAEELSLSESDVSYHIRQAKDFFALETQGGIVAAYLAWKRKPEEGSR